MKICVIRLSAMGDVAMSVHVLTAFSKQYPDHEICLITRPAFAPLFEHIPNLTVKSPDLKQKHKGVYRLYKFYKSVKKECNPDFFIDIHDVLRTKILRSLFRFPGLKTAKTDKGRAGKKALTRQKNKLKIRQKHSVERYADAFGQVGFELDMTYEKFNHPDFLDFKVLDYQHNIGLAPFAAYPEKTYPFDQIRELTALFEAENIGVYIFGGGADEQKKAHELERDFKNVRSLIGNYKLAEEIRIIAQLDAMITPDSGNMHLASLTNTPIVSVWGATHPFAGFAAYVPPERHKIVQNDKLACRPCSVFGNKACFKGNLECMTSIKPAEIFEHVLEFLKNK